MSRSAALAWVFLHLGVGVAEAAERGPDPLGECRELLGRQPRSVDGGVVAGSDTTVNGSVPDTSDWNMTLTDPGPPAVARCRFRPFSSG